MIKRCRKGMPLLYLQLHLDTTLAQPPGNCVSSLILDLLKPQCNAAILLRTEVRGTVPSVPVPGSTRTLY